MSCTDGRGRSIFKADPLSSQRAQQFLDDMFAAIEHGDEQHRQWLKDELQKWHERLTAEFECHDDSDKPSDRPWLLDADSRYRK